MPALSQGITKQGGEQSHCTSSEGIIIL